MTDPKAVKPIIGKQYQGNSPKPYWLIEKATETFGPVGIGWGVEVKSERFERMGEFDVLHVAVVSVWYCLPGSSVRSSTFDQMGGTKAAYKNAKGVLMVDDDAGKKSVTDGMVKCLSMIGFAGDIFAGRWDDTKYVAEAAKQYANRPSTPEGHAPDMSHAGRAARITAGVENDDAEGAALALSGFSQKELDSVWALLDAKTQDKLTAAWPQVEAA